MLGIPWVAGGREAARLRRDRRAQLGHVGAAERHETGRPELLRQVGRDGHGQVAQRPDAERGWFTDDGATEILEQDRYPAKRSVGQLAARLGPCLVEPGADHRVQVWVDRLDTG